MRNQIKRKSVFAVVSALLLTAFGCSKDSGTGPQIPNEAVIDMGNTQQVISGFGGQNMPGWIPDLTPAQVQKAFGTDSGQIGFSIMRVRVPFDSTKFNLEPPSARLAKSFGAIIIASPWTPPAWMKTGNLIGGGSLDTGAYAPYAAHLKSFADYMSANGASLYAVSLQNEPDYSADYESCTWSTTQMIAFLKNNAAAIGTRIIVPESMNFNHALSDPILNDAAASANVSIIGGHIYGANPTSYPLAVGKGKEVWMTEHLVLDTLFGGNLETAMEINNCMNAGMNAYLWWYIRRFYGPIDDSSNVTKRGYFMSQYARFVRPGFNRIATTANPQTNVYVTAYRNGDTFVVVVINSGSTSINQVFAISNGTAAGFAPYVTSQSKNCARGSDVAVSNSRFTGTLEPYSVTTFVSIP